MKVSTKKLTLLAFSAAFALGMHSAYAAADAIYYGGSIITINDKAPSAEAVAVKSGKIVAVGKLDAVQKQKGKKTEMVDLKGRTLMPGFVDPHAHFASFGTQAVGANLLSAPDGNVETIDDLVAKLKEFANNPDVKRTGWIFGLGYDDALLGRHPTKEDLDKVSTTMPVMAIHISGHLSAMNSFALKMVGVDANTKDPNGGRIRRMPGSQEPNGVQEETAHFAHMLKAITPQKEEDNIYFFKKGIELAKSFGYTTAQEGRAFKANHQQLQQMSSKGIFDIDVISYVDFLDRKLMPKKITTQYKDHYRIAGMKVTLDGSPQGRTAWRTVPYVLPPDGQKEGYMGYPAVPNEKDLIDAFTDAHKNKWQVQVHANGDAAVDQFINVSQKVTDKLGKQDTRNVLIHGQFTRQDQLDSLKKLNIMASFFTMHTFYWGDWYDKIIGPQAAQMISPAKSAMDKGIVVTAHTDAPVALPSQIQVIDATVNRTSRSGKVMGPNERISVLDALKMSTIWAAYQTFEEKSKGSLEVGKRADMIILDQNPLTIEKAKLKTIKVMQTIKDGKTVYQR